MKKPLSFTFIYALFFFGFTGCSAQNNGLYLTDSRKVIKIAYFNPEVFPDLEEIKAPTNTAFFSAVSDKLNTFKNNRLLFLNTSTSFDNTDKETIREFCLNNSADFAVIPKVKYFKVGIGTYVFSNQVEVSMKLYDAQGNFITESSYNTFRKNARILGSAENSIKIGTNGALKDITKNMRRIYRAEQEKS
ncbi:pyruvate decarboxylase [Chryseobacterium sp.]|uniref:pyruvate decarboxylase n=1 Tax=Chryseobacterium sp. TaxID=1871047 RepID=UPI0011C86D76|nr:pyruvate decarboxylase [Chryseobacterium sp.]TXF77658.1 pyruvate decarboxylase [Chryseobacterium sp.]